MYNPRKNIAAPANVNQPKLPQMAASTSLTPPSLTFSPPVISKVSLPTTTVDDLLKKIEEQAAAFNNTNNPSPKP